MTRSVREVLIVGRDAEAWIAALAVHRALGRTGVKVRVLELPSLLKPADVFSALPSLFSLNTLLGLTEAEVLAQCAGVPVIAQRFSNWGKSRAPFLHGYDTPLPGDRDIDFIHYWLKARNEGLRVELEDFSLAAAAAKQGRIAASDGPPGGLSAAPGYHLDACAYAGLLRSHAQRAGVAAVPGRFAGVERLGDRIAAIRLEDGSGLEADLYIDASGVESALIGGLPGAQTVSWAEWLPCDRILAASGARLPDLPAFSQVSAFHAGWVGLFPLQDRTAVVAAYRGEDCSDTEMLETLPLLSGIALEGDGFVTPFEAGMRPRPWIGNCIAIGEAAVRLEPIDAVQLHLLHVCVSHLMGLFPADADRPLEAEAYNKAIASHAGNLRDFQAAHYKLNRRYDEAFWDRVRARSGPATLEAKIRIFASRGMIPLNDDETFQELAWSASFLGHGVIPASHDPRVDLVPPEQHMEKVQQRLRTIAAQVRAMPTVEAYLAAAAVAPAR